MMKLEINSIGYYENHAEAFVERTSKADLTALYQPFLRRLPEGAHILDVGCGSGRDAAAFLKLGYKVTATDPSKAMVEASSRLTGQPTLKLAFWDLKFEREFDGIWACASLLHVPKVEMNLVLHRLTRALKPGGCIYLSFKHGQGERVEHGRLFNDYTEDSFRPVLALQTSLTIERIWVSHDQRPGRVEKWLNIVARRTTAAI